MGAIARRLARQLPPSFDMEDLGQEGLIALWRYAQSYNPAKNDNFRGYAYLGIRGAMLMKCRRKEWTAANGEELEPQMVCAGPNPEAGLQHARETRIADYSRAGQRGEIVKRLRLFPPEAYLERYLVERHHLDGIETDVLSKLTGMTETDVKKRLRSGVRRLKKR